MNEKDQFPVGLKRRNFLLLGAAAAVCAGCKGMGGGGLHIGAEQRIDAGPAANYAADGVYSNFRSRGFFIIRRGDKLEALSSICTHRRCKVNVDGDNSFFCHCHGSTYDPDGRVTNGPAKLDLSICHTAIDASGHLLVDAPA